MDVRFARSIFEQRAHQRKRSHGQRNHVGDDDADGTAEQHDEQRFGEELSLDVPFTGAQSTPQADFPNALIDRDEHDVHDADAADSEREDADKDEQHLQSDGDAVDDGAELFAAEHLNGLLVAGRELLAGGDRGENLRLRARLELRCDGFKHEHVGVLRVPKIFGCGVGDPGRLVVAGKIVAQLDLAVHGADHVEPHARNDDRLAYGGASAEQLLAHARAQKHDTTAFEFVERVDPAALRRLFVAHIAVLRADAADGRGANHAVSVGDAGTAHGLKTGVAYVGGGLLDHVDVGLLEDDLLAGTLAAGLFAGLLRPADDGALAEGVEAANQNFAETASVRDQQRDGGDSPYDAEHGERAASAIASQCDPGFAEDLVDHASHRPRGARLRWDRWRRRGEPDTTRTGWRWFRALPWLLYPPARSATDRRRSPASAAGRQAHTGRTRSAAPRRR